MGMGQRLLRGLCLLVIAACAAPTSESARVRRKVLLDCDPGVDDTFALLWLCARQDAVEIVALTTAPGNVAARMTMGNALRAMRFFGCPMNLTLGVGIAKEKYTSDHFMLSDGLMGLAEGLGPEPPLAAEPPDAASVILDAIDRFGRELAILAVGPLTNLAAAERQRPGALRGAGDLYIMGGAFAGGNVRPWAEFNFWCDAASAREVFASVAHAVLFPLDITTSLCFGGEYVDRMGADGPHTEWLRSALVKAGAQSKVWKQRCIFIHDPFPVGFLLRPDLFHRTERLSMNVEVNESSVGHSHVVVGGLPNAWRALSVEESLFDVLASDVGAYLRTLATPRAEL